MQKILISSCLVGEKVRYDGKAKAVDALLLKIWQEEGRLIPLCPEVSGGLAVPRAAAEIQGNQVFNIHGVDVTDAFALGADKALMLCKKHNIHIAILKEGSPSCGTSQIYDGTFKQVKIAGQGVTACLLVKHGVQVFSEMQLDKVQALLSK